MADQVDMRQRRRTRPSLLLISSCACLLGSFSLILQVTEAAAKLPSPAHEGLPQKCPRNDLTCAGIRGGGKRKATPGAKGVRVKAVS